MIGHNQILRKSVLFKYWMLASGASIMLFVIIAYKTNAFKIATYSKALILTSSGNGAYKDSYWGDSGVLFSKALSISPEPEKIKFNLANTYYQQGRYKDAIAIYEELLTNKKSILQPTILNNEGNAYFKKGLILPSLEAYKAALVLRNNDDTIRQNMLFVFSQYEKMLKAAHVPDGAKKGDSKKEGTKKEDNSNKQGGEKAPLDDQQPGKYNVSDRQMESLLKIAKEQERVPQGARGSNNQSKKAESNGPDY